MHWMKDGIERFHIETDILYDPVHWIAIVHKAELTCI